MNFDLNRPYLISSLIAAAAFLSACGGGQSSSPDNSNPTSANQRSASALAAAPANSSSWVLCANEGGACLFSGTRQVRFGTTSKYATRSATSSIACDNSVFGDPAYGTAKQCWYQATPVAATPPVVTAPTTSTTSNTTWALCGTEGTVCNFSGSRQVRYGTVTQNVTRTVSNQVLCDNSTFGDPAYGQAKSCWVAQTVAATTPVAGGSPQTTTPKSDGDTPISKPDNGTSASGIPTPESIAGKTKVGRITAVSGQVIENLSISTTSGPCVVVPAGVTNVTIRNNEIGPCGSAQGTIRNEGVFIDAGASNVLIQRNVIHDMSSALFAAGAQHPIVFDRNFVFNIRGPMWQGQMVQFNGVRGGTGQSKITCNVKDGLYGPPPVIGARSNEDHISLYNTVGNGAGAPVEIAYNRIRGNASGGGRSGSGMQLGDGENGGQTSESGWYYVHDNTIVRTNGVGIGVAGGHDIRVENNRIDNRGLNQASQTGWSFQARNFSANQSCNNITFANNRTTIASLWAFNNDGSQGAGIYNGGGCSYTSTGNNFNDTSLNPAMFDESYSQCN